MELWKKIAPDYEVSTLGNVRSLKRKTPKILSPALDTTGYFRVGLYIDGKQKMCSIHRLVAEAFIPNPDNLPQINHINGIKTDNRLENLEWCTPLENNRHAFKIGLNVAHQGEDSCLAKLTNEQARYIRDNPDDLKQIQLAAKFDIDQAIISNIQLGKSYRNAGGTIRNEKNQSSLRIPDEVRAEIKRLYKPRVKGYSSRALAKKFGVGATSILNIIKENN